MKKFNKNLYKLLILILLCLISTTVVTAVEVTTWNYKKTGLTNSQGPFTDRAACQTDLDKFKASNPLAISTECTSSVDITTNTTDNTSFCTIISAVWSPSKIDNYKDNGTDVADIVVKTKNCVGAIGVNFTVWGISAASHPLNNIENTPLTIPNDNFLLHIVLGEDKCSVDNNPHCDLAIGFNQGNQDIFYSKGKPSGELRYDCTGLSCLGRNAQFLSLVDQGSDDKPVEFTPGAVLTSDSVYTMLAPIGGITCMDSSGQDPKCISNDIGKYLNVIFKLAIGICAALAVIMLIINGIKYMGDESVFGKTEAKKNMFGAIVGLLIALGAWALLNTINPALTGQNGLNISSANIEIEEPPMVVESTGIPALGVPLGTSGTQNYCPDGRGAVIVGNKTIMNTCKTISSKITKLINDASAQNIKLSGASFRSYSDQKQARINNKCPDVLTSPPESCKPPTAIPGTSMHEGGLAVDFQCNGQIIKKTDNECFVWLTKNAQSAGLKNYAKEPWHWSTNGK